jgi:uncharacterized damage-inducible protein DinB
MLLDHYQAMARYNRWMNEKLYASCTELTEQERTRDRGAFFGSIHGTLNHILLADHTWMRRFTGDVEGFAFRDARGEPIEVRSLDQELYSDFEELRSVRQKSDANIESWVAGLSEEYLRSPLRYRTSTGEEHEHPSWWALSHFFNHQTHHRGQVTTLLKQLGIDPGVTDLAVMLRTEPNP